MGESYRGLTIRIGADTSDLKSALKSANSALSSTQSELRKITQALRFDPMSVSNASMKIELLSERATAAASKLKELRNAEAMLKGSGIEEMADATENAALEAKRALEQYNRVDAQLERLKTTMRSLAGYDMFEGDPESARTLVGALATLDNELGDVTRRYVELKKTWQTAYDENETAKQIAAYKELQTEIARTEAEIKSLSKQQASLFSQRFSTEGDEALSGMRADAAALEAQLRQLDDALRLDPTNITAASAKMANLTQQAAASKDQLELLRARMREIGSGGIEELAASYGIAQKSANAANAELAETSALLSKARGEADSLASELRAIEIAEGPDSAAFAETEAAVRSARAEVQRLEASQRSAMDAAETASAVEEYRKLQTEVAQTESKIASLESQMQGAGRSFSIANSALTTLGLSLYSTVTPAVGQFGSYAVQSADDIDSAYRNMRKTVQGTESDFENLRASAEEYSLDNFASADTILGIQAMGGQLGIAVDNLQEFAVVASNLDIATDLESDEIAESMGQLSGILSDLTQEDFPRFGDALVRLGNNSPTLESNIVDVTKRIGSMGSIMGFTTPEILAWATAVASTGQNAEAAGTAVSKTMSDIEAAVAEGGDKLSSWSSVARMSAEEFAAAWSESPSKAMQAFVEGLKAIDESGGSVDQTLASLGINEVRQKQALQGLTQTTDVLSDSLVMSKDAWDGVSDQWGQAGDAAREASRKAEGFSGQLQILKNNGQVLASQFAEALVPAMEEGSDILKDVSEGFSNLSPEMKTAAVAGTIAVGALGPAMTMFAAGSNALIDLKRNLSGGGDAFAKIAKAARSANPSVDGFFSSMASGEGKVGRAVASVSGAGTAFGALGAAVVVTGALVAKNVDMIWGEARRLEESAASLEDSTFGAGGIRELASSLEDLGGKSRIAAVDVNDIADANRRLAESIRQTNDKASKDNGELESYVRTIEQLAGGNLDEEGLARLKLAVEGVNEALGSSYSVAQDADGAYQLMSDGAVVAAQSVRDLAEAQMSQARAAAYSSNYSESLDQFNEQSQQVGDLTKKLAALKEEKQAYIDMGEYGLAGGMDSQIAKAENDLRAAQASLDAVTKVKAGYEELMLLEQMVSEDALAMALATSTGLTNAVAMGGQSILDMRTQLAAVGTDAQALAALSPEVLAQIGTAYDGTFGSIASILSQNGVLLDQQAAGMYASLEAAVVAGAGMSQAFAQSGSSIADLTQFVLDSGLSVEQLSNISQNEMAALADAFALGGDEASRALQEFASSSEDSAARANGAAESVNLTPIVEEAARVAEVAPEQLAGLASAISEVTGMSGEEAAQALASAIEQNGGDTAAAVDQVLADASDADVSAFEGTGSWIVQGLASGISSNSWVVSDAIARVVAEAKEAADSAAGVGSPAKEFMPTGYWISAGLGSGIGQGEPIALQAMEDVVDGVRNESSLDLWDYGYHAAVDYSDGLYQGSEGISGSVSGAVGDEMSEAERLQREYIDQMISNYKERVPAMHEASSALADAMWGVFEPAAMKDWAKPFTGAVYESMEALEAAGYTLDDYMKKLDDAAAEKAEWDAKAAQGLSESESSRYSEWLAEYEELNRLSQSLAASLDDMQKYEGLYLVKEEAIDRIDSATESADALRAMAGRTGVAFSQEFAERISDGSEEAQEALRAMSEMGDEELQKLSDAYRDAALAEREAEINARSMYVNSLKYTDMATPQERMLDFRETCLDVKEALYSDSGLSAAFEFAGASVEGFALDLESVGYTMEDFAGYYESFVGSVSNGFSQFTKYGLTGLDEWTENLKLNKAEAQDWASNVTAVFEKLPESVDSEAFRKAVLEGGMQQWGMVFDELAELSGEQIAQYVELYNSSLQEGQLSAIEAFRALAPGEEYVTAIVEGLATAQPEMNEGMELLSKTSVAALLEQGPEWFSTGAGLAGEIASGIQSQIGSIAAAAAATVRAAIAAAQAAASGGTAGYASGGSMELLSSGRAAQAASAMSAMAQAARMVPMAQSARSLSTVNNTSNVNMSFTINTQPGQTVDVKALAKEINTLQEREMRARGIR